ncbi:hypothetical protein LCX93_07030 [Sulfurimonas sp. SWIR-19]|uniref:hypothetical protein n=1 Tax=Sulfurimonas sp. SWIR-19 TaxID=2878390 RepID=UPI001CF41676|nr:hypothetical protein [Sulfurimonas sp. SWIR-19]UCM99292.1 hypothetical protein LCX93_07030 [Sulfurimonas sp. SWIR-19]
MYIKRYTIAALVWMGLVGWYVYAYVTQENMSIDLFGIPMPSLSIALWVIIPIFILYLASVAHMTFYSIIGNFRLRKYEKDYEKLINAVIDAYLGKKERNYTFKTDRYTLLGTLLQNSEMHPVGEIIGKINNEKIEKVLRIIQDVKNGEVVDLKPYNLPSDNELVIQNERNRYKKGQISAENILTNCTKYDDSICKEVYVDYVKTAPLSGIEKYKSFLTKEALHVILSRINADENILKISNEVLIDLFKKLDLSKKDYIEISSILSKGGMIPEQRIKLFETLSEEDEDAVDAYLYTLYDLEMIAPANAILDNSQPDEYQNFKAYRALKECGQNFSIDMFL